ncbi:hypothetical protein LPJ78_000174 [Coemansia sp. RSA 989]|nr:hypothetical protein LPJ78_000174 [Coemansia sp. RSA 989]
MNNEPSKHDFDMEALLVDQVNDAELVVGDSTSNTSIQMFSRAADAVANAKHALFIECNSGSLRDAISNAQLDTSGLDRIIVKYVKSADMLRALLASWHCELATQLTQEDFLVWSDVKELQACIPDYLFINGIDAITSASSMSPLWALMNSTLYFINQTRNLQGLPNCKLFIGLTEETS